jgi:hypothetical protein
MGIAWTSGLERQAFGQNIILQMAWPDSLPFEEKAPRGIKAAGRRAIADPPPGAAILQPF